MVVGQQVGKFMMYRLFSPNRLILRSYIVKVHIDRLEIWRVYASSLDAIHHQILYKIDSHQVLFQEACGVLF